MGGRGFSFTRLILVVVLLAARVGIGRIVTPPPAGPQMPDPSQSAVVEGASEPSAPGAPPKSAQDPLECATRDKLF